MEELLRKLYEARVRYVVIGGQAMVQEGMPRFTLDWDLFVPPFDQENFDRINRAWEDELDMALTPLDPQSGKGFVQTFQTSAGVVQFHLAPPGLPKFATVEERAVTRDFHGIPVKYLCLDDLLIRSVPTTIKPESSVAGRPTASHFMKVTCEADGRFSSMPSATMFAVLPIMVMLPPKQAPKRSAHHSGKSFTLRESCSITGQNAATKITLSTNADPTAEVKKMNGTSS